MPKVSYLKKKMIKKDLSEIKKYMKLESTMLQIGEIYNIYLKKNDGVIVHKELAHFHSLDSDTQELYLKNFKKVLSGALDVKLFELDFMNLEDESNTQKLLYKAVDTKEKSEFMNNIDNFAQKIAENFPYESDIVITFAKCEYWKGSSKRRKEADEAIDDNVTAFNFLIGVINKIEHPKKALQFDYEDKAFRVNSINDAIINLSSPIEGLMFPTFNDNYSDVNHLMYYSNKPKEINPNFLQLALNCKWKSTGEEEKNSFDNILKAMAPEGIKTEVIQSVYEKLLNKIEVEQDVVVNLKDIKEVFEESGIDIKDIGALENAYNENVGDLNHEFKVSNIVPALNTKSIKITSEIANINISPSALKHIKQVKDINGNTCLLIKLEQTAEINGIELETESFSLIGNAEVAMDIDN